MTLNPPVFIIDLESLEKTTLISPTFENISFIDGTVEKYENGLKGT